VFEETGIKTEFQGILGLRELNEFRFDNGDLYFICLLKALTTDIKIQEFEIEASEWISFVFF
jgi:hypothetical protein